MALATITGASGLLGSNLAVELLKQDHRVRATRRGTSKVSQLEGHAIEWVSADLSDVEALVRAFTGADVVFHCAAQVGVEAKISRALHGSNVVGTQNVLAAVKQSGVKRLVHCSSTVAVGLSEDGQPCTERTPWNFEKYGLADGYVTTKHQSEELVMAAAQEGLDVVVANPGYMIGPMDVRPSSGKFVLEVAKGKTPGKSPGFNCFVDVRDVARGMVLVWQKGRTGERYILGGENEEYGRMMDRVARVAGVRPPRFYFPQWLAAPVGWFGDLQEMMGSRPLINSMALRHAWGQRFIFTSAKAEQELGYTHGPLEDAIRDCLAWFKQAGMW